MKLRSTIMIVIFITSVVFVTFFHTENKTVSQDGFAQICCKNIITTSTSKNLTFAKGVIASLQNNEVGSVTWIAFGSWNITNSTGLTFDASFYMVKIDSSEKHKYKISDFILTNSSTTPVSVTINGTATINLSAALLKDVPISIHIMDKKLSGQTVSIWIDPSRAKFVGNTPVYGIVNKLAR